MPDPRRQPESQGAGVWTWKTDIDARVLRRDELRELDRRATEELGLPSIVLMENAAIGAAGVVLRALDAAGGGAAAIVAGTGNNGGDGLALARQLRIRRRSVRVLLVGQEERLSPDAAINLGALRGGAIRLEVLQTTDEEAAFETARVWLEEVRPAALVDALLGTGVNRPVEGPAAGVIRAINDARARAVAGRVISLDLPSGLDADTGRPQGVAVRADATATFAALKEGFFTLEAQEHVGEIELLPIGVPPELTVRFGRPVDGEARANYRRASGLPTAHRDEPPSAGRDAGADEEGGARR